MRRGPIPKKTRKSPTSKRPKAPDFLLHLDEFVSESIGEKGLSVLHSVGDGATDEIIEESTQLKIAEIRSILNHLHSYGFVDYTREKNMQNGWFTYTWKLNLDRAMRNFLMMKRKECDTLRETLSTEECSAIYSCRKGCSRFSFEPALDRRFKCDTCKNDLHAIDNRKELKRVEVKIAALEKMLSAHRDVSSPRPGE
ncbi:hypothetical protein KJ765_01870 [Candidatus Micrarchaeota archaeon]|nr:hypothetical protein [Candidatus Micrarchaeota archaeon]